MVMKLFVALLFALFPLVLGHFGDFLLGWTEGNRKVQIAFVMFIFPLIMNALQYYIIDTFIKKQESKSPHLPDDDERIPIRTSESDDEDDDVMESNIPEIQPSSAAAGGISANRKQKSRTRSFEDNSFVYSTDEDDEHAITTDGLLKSQKQKDGKKDSKLQASSSSRVEEYDPEVDGDTSTNREGASASGGKR